MRCASSFREASLYRFDADGKEWKQRGKGVRKLRERALDGSPELFKFRSLAGYVRFLAHKETKKVRAIFRQAKTLKLRMNHQSQSQMSIRIQHCCSLFLSRHGD